MLSALLSLAALPLVAKAIGFSLDNKMIQEPGIIRYPIAVTAGAPPKNHILRRQQNVDTHAQLSGFIYSIEIQVGTPPQPVSVVLDTGASELWINPVCSKSNNPAFCEKMGHFNGSQTFTDTRISNRLNYGNGYAQIEYGYDYIQIGSAKISQQIFGVATDSEFVITGVMGVGPQLRSWTSDYPMILDNMVSQKFIKSRVFSLDIRSIDSDRGSVVFGGIDTKKFSGYLEKRPIIPAAQSPDKLTRYWIYLDGVSVTKNDGSKVRVFDQVNGQAVLLDSGFTASSLPTKYFNKIKDAFPGVIPPPEGDNSGMYRVPCSVGDLKGSVDFTFGKTIIKVPFKDFIWKQSANNCILGVTPDDKFAVLGDSFLRAAYAVFDMDNHNIHLANNQDCGSSLLPVGKGPDAVPSVQGDCGKESKSMPNPRQLSSGNSTTTTTLVLPSTTGWKNHTSTIANATTSTVSRASHLPSASTTGGARWTNSTSTISATTSWRNSTGTAPMSTTSRVSHLPSASTTRGARWTNSTSTISATTSWRNSTGTAPMPTTSQASYLPSALSTGGARWTNSTSTILATTSWRNSTGTAPMSTTSRVSHLPSASSTGGFRWTNSTSIISATSSWQNSTSITANATATSMTTGGSRQTNSTALLTKSATTQQQSLTTPMPLPTSSGWPNRTVLTYTTTFLTTRVTTITDCPAHVTSCPIGAVTTETITGITTWCPGNGSQTPQPLATSTEPAITSQPTVTSQQDITSVFTTTKTYTISSCTGSASCNRVTAEVVTATTYVCPQTTATYTITRTHECCTEEPGCKPGDEVVNVYTLVVEPQTMADVPRPAPGCDNCILPPPIHTLPPKTTTVATRSETTSSSGNSQTTPAPASNSGTVPSSVTSVGTISSSSDSSVATVTSSVSSVDTITSSSVSSVATVTSGASSVSTITSSITITNVITLDVSTSSGTPCATCSAQTSTPPITAGAAESYRVPLTACFMLLGTVVLAVW